MADVAEEERIKEEQVSPPIAPFTPQPPEEEDQALLDAEAAARRQILEIQRCPFNNSDAADGPQAHYPR